MAGRHGSRGAAALTGTTLTTLCVTFVCFVAAFTPLPVAAVRADPLVSVQLPFANIRSAREEAARDLTNRFAVRVDVKYNLGNSGAWTEGSTFDSMVEVWQLLIETNPADFQSGVQSLSFAFDTFSLPKGGFMIIHSVDETTMLGPYSKAEANMWTLPLSVSSAIVRVTVPKGKRKAAQVQFSFVTVGFKRLALGGSRFSQDSTMGATSSSASLSRSSGSSDTAAASSSSSSSSSSSLSADISGSCNVDVACPLADNVRSQVDGVVMVLISAEFLCSGSLISNALGTSLFVLTAHHCISDISNPTFQFIWKREALQCGGLASNPGMHTKGGSIVATYDRSDFALIHLNEIPTTVNAFVIGWDRSNRFDHYNKTRYMSLHHPNGDVKKVSLAGTLSEGKYGSNPHIEVKWATGTTEGGSSGGPLLSTEGLIVGQLHGGWAACTLLTGSDWFGPFQLSWLGGGTVTTSLASWLDPTNTGITKLMGKPLAELQAHTGSTASASQPTTIDATHMSSASTSSTPVPVRTLPSATTTSTMKTTKTTTTKTTTTKTTTTKTTKIKTTKTTTKKLDSTTTLVPTTTTTSTISSSTTSPSSSIAPVAMCSSGVVAHGSVIVGSVPVKAAVCSWTITSPSHLKIRLSFSGVMLRANLDSVAFDNATVTSLSTASSSAIVWSTGPRMTVTFASTGNVGGATAAVPLVAFQASVAFLCGGDVAISKAATIANGMSTALYENNMACKWSIAPPAFMQAIVIFTLFNVQTGDSLNAVVSKTDTVTLTGLTTKPSPLILQSGASLLWTTDAASVARGFTAFARMICKPSSKVATDGAVITDGDGTFTANTSCVWSITAPKQFNVRLLLSVAAASIDSLAITDGKGSLLRQFTKVTASSAGSANTAATQTQVVIDSSINTMGVEFRSEAATGRSEFTSIVKFVCKPFVTVTSNNTVIASSQGHYPAQLNCMWQINAPSSAHRVILTITTLAFASGSTNDHVTLSGVLPAAAILTPTKRGTYISVGSDMTVSFFSSGASSVSSADGLRATVSFCKVGSC